MLRRRATELGKGILRRRATELGKGMLMRRATWLGKRMLRGGGIELSDRARHVCGIKEYLTNSVE